MQLILETSNILKIDGQMEERKLLLKNAINRVSKVSKLKDPKGEIAILKETAAVMSTDASDISEAKEILKEAYNIAKRESIYDPELMQLINDISSR